MESLKELMAFFPFEKRFGLTRNLLFRIKNWGNAMTGRDRERLIREALPIWQASAGP